MTPAMLKDFAATPIDTEFLVRSDLLGDFTIATSSAIEFPSGLLGFPECKRFALVRGGTDSAYWLQSLDHAALVFLLVDPFPHFADYSVEIAAPELLELGAASPADLAVLAIVTLPPPGLDARPTANLQGPVAVNLRERRGKQIIAGDSDFGVRCPFDLVDVESPNGQKS
jgi:flagellar assembly factor FliW